MPADPIFRALRMAALAICAASPGAAQDDMVGFSRGDFGSVVLSQRQFAGEFEAAISGYNNEPIETYSANSAFAQLGRSVGRLDILTDVRIFPCTAFIVDDDKLLTNWHCVPGITEQEESGATRIQAVKFLAGYTRTGVEEDAQFFDVNPIPLEYSEALDYAVLEVFGRPADEFGKLELSDRTLEEGDPFWIIGHPMGEAQRISREQCRAANPAISGDQLRHTCDTLPGNSGSPVIDASRQTVVALHHAGSRRDQVNFAVPMALILDHSEVLTPAAAPQQGETDPPGAGETSAPSLPAGPDCTALYGEAERIGACFAYRAYVEICGDHPFGAFARFYVAEECVEQVVQANPDPEPEPPPPEPEPEPEPEPLYDLPRMVRFGSNLSIAATPVTVSQFREFVNQSGYRPTRGCRLHTNGWRTVASGSWDNPGYFPLRPDQPVTCVTQRDANAYITWLRRATGDRYHLPTTPQWQRLARDVDPYSNSVCLDCATRSNAPMPVGSAGYVNGLADIVGNVWQWSSTCSGNTCNLHGGAWETERSVLKSREFSRDPNAFRTNALGFRVVRYD